MTRSTLVLVLLAALGIGSLVGVSLVDEDAVQRPAGSDPVGIGGAPVFRYLGAEDVTLEYDEFGRPQASVEGENFIARDAGPASETVTLSLAVDEAVEYKALMQQGDTITFRWSTDGDNVYYDLHGHDPTFGEDFFTRYDEGEGTERSGSIMAPYSGQHGWFWLNLGDTPTAITLEVSGFYEEIIEIDLEGY